MKVKNLLSFQQFALLDKREICYYFFLYVIAVIYFELAIHFFFLKTLCLGLGKWLSG